MGQWGEAMGRGVEEEEEEEDFGCWLALLPHTKPQLIVCGSWQGHASKHKVFIVYTS